MSTSAVLADKTSQKNVRHSRKRQAKAKVASAEIELLGQILTWKASTTHSYAAVVQALKDEGLNEKMAKELNARDAFTRACHRLGEERIIRVVRNEKDTIVFQFNKPALAADGEWTYPKETNLTLDKNTGKVTCKIKDLEAKAQAAVIEAQTTRTRTDITNIVQRLFDEAEKTTAGLSGMFSIRDAGGAYFVFADLFPFVDRIDRFLTKVNGSLDRWPIPKGEQAAKAVQNTVGNAMAELVKEHNEAIDLLTINTRRDTIDGLASKIKLTRVKIEAYANYLKDRQDDLVSALSSAEEKLRASIDKLATERATTPPDAGAKRPGVIYEIIRKLRMASATEPVTKEGILIHLKACFPTRDEAAMKSTIASQVPSGLKIEKSIVVQKNDKGYWIETPSATAAETPDAKAPSEPEADAIP